MIPLFIIIPIASAFLISVLRKLHKNLPDILATLACLLLLVLSFVALYMLHITNYKPFVYKLGGWEFPLGITMVLDGLSVLMLIVVNFVALIAIIFSISYMEKYTDKNKYFILFMIMLASMNGLITTGDIFNMYVFLEVGTISSCVLIAFGTEKEELEASFKYLVLSTVASTFILLSVAIIYSYTSSLNMADISLTLSKGSPSSIVIGFLTVLFITGFGIKSAIVPFHAWLPDAHPAAPAPISAMLSSVLIKSLGIYSLLRLLFNVLGVTSSNILVVLGLLSMVAGGFLAIYQKDLKRLLAYSTISQIGYIIFAFGLGTPLGILAGLFHLVNHAFAKLLLFLNSGAVVYATEERNMDNLGGLRQKMPVTAATSLIGSMSISGVPPFGGFWSKLLIIFAAIQAGKFSAAGIAIIISIVTLSYYLKLQKKVFFGKLPERWQNIKEVPLAMVFSMIIPAVLCVFLGLLLLPEVKAIFLDPAVEVIKNGVGYGSIILQNIK
ncbi:MAG: proton-conducting transporter membrane subunit [Elusimicrobia bacterium]|nr:proton-conducting transporter membrane subunit [Elusimicrobiota bacterium]